MISLTKSNQQAITFVKDFLEGNWIEQDNGSYKYQNIGYAEIKNPVATFRGYFVLEQDYKCCYCCRSIENDAKSELEHIIPRSKKEINEFEPYYVHSDILRNNVVPQSLFEESKKKLNLPPFPHHVSYHNIVASCNGKTFDSSSNFTCCNRERGDEFIPPFNLMTGSVSYLKDGTIVYNPELANREYFGILNLDKIILNQIRRLWFLFTNSTLTLPQILDDKYIPDLKEKIVAHAMANSPDIANDTSLTATFSNENTWAIFKEYFFFFTYYKSIP